MLTLILSTLNFDALNFAFSKLWFRLLKPWLNCWLRFCEWRWLQWAHRSCHRCQCFMEELVPGGWLSRVQRQQHCWSGMSVSWTWMNAPYRNRVTSIFDTNISQYVVHLRPFGPFQIRFLIYLSFILICHNHLIIWLLITSRNLKWIWN